MTQRREISGRFTGERHVFISQDGLTRRIIATVETPDGDLTIAGDAAEGELVYGLQYRLFGAMKPYTNKRTGAEEMQFAFDSFVVDTPAGMESITVYLEQLDGIGPAKSAKLWTLYGSDAVRMLREQSADVAAAIKWDATKAADAAFRLNEWASYEGAKLDLLGLLHGRGLPKKTVEKAIEQYGSAAALLIRRSPYLLMQYRGVGFKRADQLYCEFGHNPARMKRQALCAWNALASNSEGHTWHTIYTVRKSLRDNIAGQEPNLEKALQLSTRAKMLSERIDPTGGRWVAERSKADAECRVAGYIDLAEHEFLSGPSLRPSLGEICSDATGITAHQARELAKAISSIVGVMAGSPGTGKTYTSAALIRLLISVVGSEHIAVCAPTGKAAVRLSEALQKNGVAIKATTIHSLLGVMNCDDGWEFNYWPGKPLPFKFVVIDESSMIDADLMDSLLSARGKGTCFLFVGDPNQLSPVGHGAPLRDMIAAGVPTGTLTEIQRNSGRIIRACAEIREGKKFAVSPGIDLAAGENLKLIHAANAETQIEALCTIMQQFKNERPQRYDPIWDVQIIVAVNKRSELGRKPLNVKLQSLLNPHGATCAGSPFRVGDKIINGKNAWFPAVEKGAEGTNEKGQFYVANGEQAEVLIVEPRRTIARLTSPDRVIVIPRSQAEYDDDSEESTGTGCRWELGYAISCHKGQGSEWPIVITMLDEYPGARGVCSRQWLYTAISRAKLLGLLIGKMETAHGMVCRDALFERKTFLVEQIRELRRPRIQSILDAALNSI